jgi:type IV secretory pathway VirB2 component (pilin)
MTSKTDARDIEMWVRWETFAIVTALAMLIPDLYAQTAQDSDVGNYICFVADNFSGNAGRGIATIGISVIGTLALVGRITWTQAIIVGVGCSVLFGAPTIITSLGAAGSCP